MDIVLFIGECVDIVVIVIKWFEKVCDVLIMIILFDVGQFVQRNVINFVDIVFVIFGVVMDESG